MKYFKKTPDSEIQAVPDAMYKVLSEDNRKLLGEEVDCVTIRKKDDRNHVAYISKEEFAKYGDGGPEGWEKFDAEGDAQKAIDDAFEAGAEPEEDEETPVGDGGNKDQGDFLLTNREE